MATWHSVHVYTTPGNDVEILIKLEKNWASAGDDSGVSNGLAIMTLRKKKYGSLGVNISEQFSWPKSYSISNSISEALTPEETAIIMYTLTKG